MKAAIRTDASLAIGSGHVMRCMALADELRGRGAEVRFICREHPGHLISALGDAKYATAVLPAPPARRAGTDSGETDYAAWLGVEESVDAGQTRDALGDFRPDWLIVDHYALGAGWEQSMRPRAGSIFAIDDLANRHHDCDLLLDQNYYAATHKRYAGRVPARARQMLGPRFALLRPEFREARTRLRERDGTVRRVLVFFGGVDATGETEKAIAALRDFSDIAVDVVVGGSNTRADAIRARCREMTNATFHRQVSNMAELMTAADFSFGAGGSSHWERCSVGLPTAATVVAANQLESTRDLAEKGVVLMSGADAGLGASAYRSILESLSSGRLRAMQSAGLGLVDGRGTERVALSMSLEPVLLRRAVVADAPKALSWRNHPDTRRYSSDANAIAADEHVAWWKDSLTNPDRALLIGSKWGVEIGVLRYDAVGDGSAVVSIYLDPALHGLGLGVSMFEAGHEWLAAHRPDIREVEAVTLSGNVRIQRALARAGFRPERDRWIWSAGRGSDAKGPVAPASD